MNTTETAHKAQETASQVIDQAKTLVDEARSSELASTATEVAHQVVDKARDLATDLASKTGDLASDLATKTGRKQPGRLSRLATSIRNHPKRYLFGSAAVAAAAVGVSRARHRAPIVSSTSGAPAYGEDTPGYRTQPGPITDMATETATAPSEPVNR